LSEQNNQTDELLTIQECADILKVTYQTIYGYINSGKLPARRIGQRLIRVSKFDLLGMFTDYEAGEFSIWGKR
jgi:excisionase family DNA binding protein